MDWKIKLEADSNLLSQMQATHTDPTAKVTRDGVDWYLESTDFELLSDHHAVREKATSIAQTVLGSKVGLGNVYRMHYDGSKSMFAPDSQ